MNTTCSRPGCNHEAAATYSAPQYPASFRGPLCSRHAIRLHNRMDEAREAARQHVRECTDCHVLYRIHANTPDGEGYMRLIPAAQVEAFCQDVHMHGGSTFSRTPLICRKHAQELRDIGAILPDTHGQEVTQ